jgi:hypothetical protein
VAQSDTAQLLLVEARGLLQEGSQGGAGPFQHQIKLRQIVKTTSQLA